MPIEQSRRPSAVSGGASALRRSLLRRAACEALEVRQLLSVQTWSGEVLARVDAALEATPALERIYPTPEEALHEGVTAVKWHGKQRLVQGGEWVLRVEGKGKVGKKKLRGVLGRIQKEIVSEKASEKLAGAKGRRKLAETIGEIRVARALGNRTFQLVGAGTLKRREILKALKPLGRVVLEPNFLVWASAAPNDPRYGELWGLNNTGQTSGKADADIDAPEAWELVASGSATDVVVGVIDTGVDYTHPDLASNMWTNPGETPDDGVDNDGNGFVDDVHGWDFYNDDANPMDDNRHGTHVAGTIGAVADNNLGVAGVARDVKIMALKFLGASGSGTTDDAIAAVNYATKMRKAGVNVRLTNNSWGGGQFSQALKDAIDASGAEGMLFVAAAGNNSSNNDSTLSYPASYDSPNIVSVASTDHLDNLSAFSNYGKTTVDLAAPGSNVLSTTPGGSYTSLSGTSMATPHVSGALALLLANEPSLTWAQAKDRLLTRVDPVPALKGKVASEGRLNAYTLLDPNWTPAPADLTLDTVAFADAGGNNDRLPNPGETVTLLPSLFNTGQSAATNVTIEILAPAGQATVVGSATRTLGDIAPRATGSPSQAFSVQLSSTLLDGARPVFTFVARYANGQQKTFTHTLTISKPNPAFQVNPGFTMGQMLADTRRNVVYVLDLTNSKVLAVDTDLGRTVAHSPTSGVPTGLAVSPDGSELYVTSNAGNSVGVFSLPELIPLRTLGVPTPTNIAAGKHGRLYVAGTGQWTAVRQVDSKTGAVLNSFGSFYSAHLVANAAGTRLYISELGLSTTGTTEYNIDGPGAPVSVKSHSTNMSNGRDLSVDEQYDRLYAMSGGQYGVYAVNRTTGTGGLWSFGGAAYGTSVTVHESLPYIWAGSQDSYSGGLFRFDRATGAVTGTFKPTGTYKGVWDVQMTGNGSVIYRAEPSSGTVQIGIMGKSSLVVSSIPSARFSHTQAVISPGLEVAFDGTLSKDHEPSGTINSYSWDFGDGSTATGGKVNHVFATPGVYSVKLTVADSQGYTDDFIATVKVSDPPAAADQSVATSEDTPKGITLEASDPNLDPLTYAIVAQPAHGTLTVNGADVVYTPAPDYFGPDSFTFKANDGKVDGNVATVSITVGAVNDAPRPKDDVLPQRADGSPTTVNVLANDSDVEGDALSIASFTQPTRGSVTRQGDTFVYTPSVPYQGFDSFTYTIADVHGATATATVSIASGVAVLDGAWTTLGNGAGHAGYFPGFLGGAEPLESWSVGAGSNNGNPIAVADGRVYLTSTSGGYKAVALNEKTGGTVWDHPFASGFSLNPPTFWDGRIYLQRGNHGGDTQLWALDAATGSTIWSAPFSAQWERYLSPAVSEEGIWINGGYYGGMYGFRHDGSQIAFVNQPQVDGWTPSIHDGFVYSFVNGTLAKYSMTGSQQWSVAKSGGINIPAFAGNRAFVIGGSNLLGVNLDNGATAWTATGSFAGSPAVADGRVYGITGTTVRALDANTGASLGTYTADATLIHQPLVTDDAVFVASASKTYVFDRDTYQLKHTVPHGGRIALANNRLYIAKADGAVVTYVFARTDNAQPTAANDAATTAEDTAVDINLLTNDSDSDGGTLRIKSFTQPTNGTVTLLSPTQVRYTPDPNFFGEETFTYVVHDSQGGSAAATVNVTVTPVNDKPVATPQRIDIPTELPANVTVSGTDLDGDPLNYTVVDQPRNGTLTGSGPDYVYTPNPGYSGADTFTYKLNDGKDDSPTVLVTLIINDAPVAQDVSVTVREEDTSPITLKGSDRNGDGVYYSIVTNPSRGSITVQGKIVFYTPAKDFIGTDSFTYRVSDGITGGNTATVFITVNDLNDVPDARDDSMAAPAGQGVVFTKTSLLANDLDVDADALQITSYTLPQHGTLVDLGDGRLRYRSANAFNGVDEFTYTISDGRGGTDSATVVLAVGTLYLGGDWTTFGNGAAHAGYFPGTALGSVLQPKWSANVGGSHQVVTGQGRVYAIGTNVMTAWSVATGQQAWAHAFPSGSLNPPTYANGRVFVQRGNHGSDSQLWALDAATGNTAWSAPFGAQWESYMAPTVADGGVYVNGGYYGGMYGYVEATGTQKFFLSSLPQEDGWTPTYYNGKLYTYIDGILRQHTPATGAVDWSTSLSSTNTYNAEYAPTVADNKAFLYIGSQLSAVDLTTRAKLWTVENPRTGYTFNGHPAVANGVVYAVSDKTVYAFNAATGALVRSFVAPAALGQYQPIVTDDVMIVSSAAITGASVGTYVFHLGTGRLVQKLDKAGVVSLSNGALYVNSGGTLYAYDFVAPEADDDAPQVVEARFDPYAATPTLVVKFSEALYELPDAGDLRLEDESGQSVASLALSQEDCTYDPSTRTAYFKLPADLPDGNYRAVWSATGVSDEAGNPMAADASLDFWTLAGDADRDHRIDVDDYAAIDRGFLRRTGGFRYGDFNYDGKIDLADYDVIDAAFERQNPALG